MTERTFETPRTFVGAIGAVGEIDYSVVVVEAVREETARERAHKRWGMVSKDKNDE